MQKFIDESRNVSMKTPQDQLKQLLHGCSEKLRKDIEASYIPTHLISRQGIEIGKSDFRVEKKISIFSNQIELFINLFFRKRPVWSGNPRPLRRSRCVHQNV